MDFTGKTALVTGAAVGIGRAVALRFAEGHAKVAIVDANAEKLEAVRAELAAYTDDVLALQCDVRDEARVAEVVAETRRVLGAPDILVNNAAIWRCWKPFLEVGADEWKTYLDVNVMGTVYFTRAVLGDMVGKGYGRIVNVASVAGVYGNANMVHYSATKGAVIALTRALAKEVAPKGVLVNCVSPGSVSPSEDADIDAFVPSELAFLGRTGTDRENASLICFLASDEASYIAGQNIQIDGCRKKQ